MVDFKNLLVLFAKLKKWNILSWFSYPLPLTLMCLMDSIEKNSTKKEKL